MQPMLPIYNQQIYNQWTHLPPNIPLPNANNLSALEISFTKLVYLNQIKAHEKPLLFTLQWWGMKPPQTLYYDQVNICQGKYLICTPLARLLSYFNDMKLLAVQISTKHRVIGKGYLNFLLLKGWQGQFYQGFIDIKQGNKKIGQLTFSMEIKTVANPFLNRETVSNSALKNTLNAGSNNDVRLNVPSMQQMIKQTQKSINLQAISPMAVASYKDMARSQSNKEDMLIRSTSSNKIYVPPHTIDPIKYEQPYHRESNEGKYQTQLIRLVEDYNLLFAKPTSHSKNSLNLIEIEVIRIEVNQKEHSQVEAVLPLFDGHTNVYKLAAGGFIKLQLGDGIPQKQLMAYLKDCSIMFRIGDKLQGAIKLSKVLSKSSQVIQVTLGQKQGKKASTRKQKGRCWIRAIPPQQKQVEKVTKPCRDMQSKAKQQEITQEYVLVNVKHYNSIQKNNRLYNLFLKIISTNNQSLAQTNTLWNSKLSCSFGEKLTCKITSNTLRFQLYDRQQSLVKIAYGQLVMKSPLGINLQVALTAKYMNTLTIVGYIGLDYFKNGLENVTKMINVLNHQRQPLKNQQKQQKKPQIQNIINKNDKEQVKEDNQHEMEVQIERQQNKQNYEEVNHTQQPKKQQKQTQDKKYPHLQRTLNILQIYNKVFTYLYSHPQITNELSHKDQHKITQFIYIMNPLVERLTITNPQLNQIISQYLHPTNTLQSVNKVNSVAFRESYDSFITYYQDIIQQKDQILQTFLNILQDIGMSINDLEYELRNDKKIWGRINELLAYHKEEHINIIEDIKKFYQEDQIQSRRGVFYELTAAQFCDILRKYQVHETSLGSQIRQNILSQRVYKDTIQVLEEIEPNISEYSYRELIGLLEEEQVILSSWELLNLKEHLEKYHQKTLPKYQNVPHMPQRLTKPNIMKQEQQKQIIRPTISKSPTFGFLHQPEHMKQQLLTSDHMVDSLAVKMHNLAISPINYNSNQTVNNPQITFSNLKYTPIDLYVNGFQVLLQSQESISQQNYQSNSNQGHSSYKQGRQQPSNPSQQPQPSHSKDLKEQYKSIQPSSDKLSMLLKLNIEKAFSYKVSLHYQQIQGIIMLQCINDEWSAIVSEQGQYLGGILIS